MLPVKMRQTLTPAPRQHSLTLTQIRGTLIPWTEVAGGLSPTKKKYIIIESIIHQVKQNIFITHLCTGNYSLGCAENEQ